MFSNILRFDRTAKIIVESIEGTLGGNVNIVEDVAEKEVSIDWKKNDKTIYALHFRKTYSYKDLEKLENPHEIASDFMESYKSSKEPKIEETKVEEEILPVEKPVIEELKEEEPPVEKPKAARAKKTAKNS